MPQRSPDAGAGDDPYADETAPLSPKQIAALLDASRRAIILWPGMGNIRRFSEPDA